MMEDIVLFSTIQLLEYAIPRPAPAPAASHPDISETESGDKTTRKKSEKKLHKKIQPKKI